MYSSQPQRPHQDLPHIKLARFGEEIHLVSPVHGSRPVPMIPSTIITWLVRASQQFWQEQRRCITYLLFFSPENALWFFDLPIQTCREDGSTWSITKDDLSHFSSNRYLLGTFQSCPASTGGSVIGIVPPFAGVHFIATQGRSHLELASYVRCDHPSPALEAIETKFLIHNDQLALLNDCRSRLQLL